MNVVASLQFPLDRLVRCGVCKSDMELRRQTNTRYACVNACGVAEPGAIELNTLVMGAIAAHLSTDEALPLLREAMTRALSETDIPDTCPTELWESGDAEVRGVTTNTRILLSEENLPTSREMLQTCLEKVVILPESAIIRYRAALPWWSERAGQVEQMVDLPSLGTT